MLAEVTQYMRPNGRQVTREIKLNDSCQEKYQDILDCGARLATEQMMSGMVSQTIETSEGDFDINLTKGTDFDENKATLETMIMRFDKTKFEEWKKQLEEA